MGKWTKECSDNGTGFCSCGAKNPDTEKVEGTEKLKEMEKSIMKEHVLPKLIERAIAATARMVEGLPHLEEPSDMVKAIVDLYRRSEINTGTVKALGIISGKDIVSYLSLPTYPLILGSVVTCTDANQAGDNVYSGYPALVYSPYDGKRAALVQLVDEQTYRGCGLLTPDHFAPSTEEEIEKILSVLVGHKELASHLKMAFGGE